MSEGRRMKMKKVCSSGMIGSVIQRIERERPQEWIEEKKIACRNRLLEHH